MRGMQGMHTEGHPFFSALPPPSWGGESTSSSEASSLSRTPPPAPRIRTIPLPSLNPIILAEVLRCGVMAQLGLAAAILSAYPIEHLKTCSWWQMAATRPHIDHMTIYIPVLDEEILVYGSGAWQMVCVGDVIHGIRQCWHRRRRPSYDQGGSGGPSFWEGQLLNPGLAFRPYRDHEWLGLTLRTNQPTWDLMLVGGDGVW